MKLTALEPKSKRRNQREIETAQAERGEEDSKRSWK